jgi:hypothetical protein
MDERLEDSPEASTAPPATQTIDDKLAICTSAAKLSKKIFAGWYARQPLDDLINECMCAALARDTPINISWAIQRLRGYHTVSTSVLQPTSAQRCLNRIDASTVREELRQQRDRESGAVLRHLIVLEALQRLPWRQRYAVVARYWCGHQLWEIARDLGYTHTGSVDWQLQTALRQLEDWLDAGSPRGDI